MHTSLLRSCHPLHCFVSNCRCLITPCLTGQHVTADVAEVFVGSHVTFENVRQQSADFQLAISGFQHFGDFCGFSLFLLRYQVKQKAFSDFHILISENAKKNCHIRFLQYSSFLIFLFTSYVKIPVPHSQLNGSVRRSFHSYHCSLFRFFYLLQCF